MPGRRKTELMIVVAGVMARPVWADDKGAKAQTVDAETKRLLLLMDQDRNGKISKQEFMAFMAAEFARLDTNKDNELNVY